MSYDIFLTWSECKLLIEQLLVIKRKTLAVYSIEAPLLVIAFQANVSKLKKKKKKEKIESFAPLYAYTVLELSK